ncbi:hypothetical protein EHI8A_107010 [Entamoeba histolytica HM-1:IMSS-B]|uniref:Uncharacterized protein n=6 Tax=Entamoeba histolytica TaxID=5759 RepID=C4LW91_ENTH1|nr:hypothetical protein EHI_155400 [Entamoeba histolytica HM-1:IMSS]EMD49718.1 Hypothetical protein EHI5A_024720 [Entamoeba histolytica KU27]EMH76854.1 hypothetical protein EHI8A_107010 [Entamoeba histolytica HM-1:IMSS-B]EMS12470.1 hypothetical protein KM1_072290 [Entamoeba histolytica HM-3:IMSS]ENY60349.1 hypothetical protein EHI7A_050340 [Entamoeba histolytica HM-1:IMSS-A]GAT92970.1 hypothetical protein CL6EHI_155400 [Entamoeba histolytica]|eukprot:XP_655722.1 hypothetical protein EHI_155400 [Entamoeba histolytica HM-1:IMSS]
MQYKIYKQQQIEGNNPQFWVNLCQSQDDFRIVINREILQQMIAGFQQEANELWKKYFFEQQTQKIKEMESVFSTAVISTPNEITEIQQELNQLKFIQEKMIRSYEVNQSENNQYIKGIERANEIINKKESQIQTIQNETEKIEVELQTVLSQRENEKKVSEKKVVKLITEHNEMVVKYDELFQSYTKYKKAYEEAKTEREKLRNENNK